LALPMITDLKQVPLGPIARDFVFGYDENPDQHVEFLTDLFWGSGNVWGFDSWEEVLAYCRDRRLLRQYPSSVWNREKACAYAEYLAQVVGRLRGKNTEPLITTGLTFDIHRGEWIRSERLRSAVIHLQEALEQAVFWFNVKQVACWFTWLGLTHVEWPDFLKELTPREVEEQAYQLDDLCYGHGRMLLAGCHRPFELIVALEDVPRETRNIFLLTPKQLQEMARLRVGAGPKKADETVLDEVFIEEPVATVEEESEERRSPGGIYLP
jgi:hypothetical protein